MKEGKHTFECWGAAQKLHEHRFATTDRGDALTPFGRKWRRILESDARMASVACPECATSRRNPRKMSAAGGSVRSRIRSR